ncbi:MAG: type II secretion system protein GspL [Gammaproteobacteria bacterium]|nr:type II secretion system protein GspL [Gammaproteobacteria bacterium]
MADFLVLRFAETPTEPVEWVLVDQSGAQHGPIEHGDLMAVTEAAENRRVIALVPGTNVLQTSTHIPIRNKSKLLQALPYAMEEQLAGDVEDLHFATGKRDVDGELPVAVVERLKMDAWLEQMSALQLDLAGVYSDSETLGQMPNTTVLLVDAGRATIREPDGKTAASDAESVSGLIELWLNAAKTSDDESLPPPINLLVYLTTDYEARVQPVLESIRSRLATLEVLLLPEGGLPRMAAQAVTSPGINLLQGPYAPKSKLTTYWPAWRLTAALMAGLVVLMIGAQMLSNAALNRQIAELDQSIEAAIRYTFPEVREIRDARALLDSKLRGMGSVTSGSNSNHFLDTLTTVAEAFSENKNKITRIETVNYRSGVMEIRLLAPNVEALDAIRQIISEKSSLEATIQSANPEGDKVRGRLQINHTGA